MTEEERDRSISSIDTRVSNLEKMVQGFGKRLSRLEGVVSEMSRGMTRLTWSINLWGGVMTILIGLVLATMKP